ncbi:glycosyltransferase family 2 protein [Bacillus sp. RO2]|uniref:glycosyltransferase family 2 protein n=1 Tax=Bacillus sp. RO2 TaxID=2723913 RepID=UPI00145DD2DC|nr:glycosyltransferase family 2 protein [Bacillus sp. RO2]NMH75296.1 glycosyltransferase family 2 protein [Bacillus sp. RO2]
MNPKVSIILPAYNCEKYISKCIESILVQTFQDFELIIVNDGSNDNTEKIIQHFIKNDSRIIYLIQKNQGPSAARNNGINKAKGDFLAFIDSDDTVKKNYVELLVNGAKNSNADLICCGYVDISVYGSYNSHDFLGLENITRENFIKMACKGTGGVLWSKLFKTSIVKKYNIFLDNDIFMCEDLIFILKYVQNCDSYLSINEYLYEYNRLNVESISSNISPAYLNNYVKVWDKIKQILTMNFQNHYLIQSIIREKVQDVAIKIVEQQCATLTSNNLRSVLYNINILLRNDYFMKYKHEFKPPLYRYKPLVFFMKYDLVLLCVLYGLKLHIAKKIYGLIFPLRKTVKI